MKFANSTENELYSTCTRGLMMARSHSFGGIEKFAALLVLSFSLLRTADCSAQARAPAANFDRLQDLVVHVDDEPDRLDSPGPVNTGARCAGDERLRASLKPLSEINLAITPAGNAPPDCYKPDADADEAMWMYWPGDSIYEFHWQASGLVHNPLYFEDVPLERYGQGYSPLLQPLVSGARFWGSALTLPYRIGVDPPHQLQYTLGYYRPGGWAPPVREHLPWSPQGALLQAGAIVGGVYLFP